MAAFDEKKLKGHPCVYKVDPYGLVLKYEFRVRLFKAWKTEQKPGEILRLLRENGLTEDLVGERYFMNLANSFKVSGFPVPQSLERTLMTDYREENPLLLSGKFIRSGRNNGMVIQKAFLQEIANRFPEVSVRESLRMAGLDPVDVGSTRIRNIRLSLDNKQDPVFSEQIDFLEEKTTEASGKQAQGKTIQETSNDESKHPPLALHPYVESADYTGVWMRNAFYNEAYLLFPLGLEQVLFIFELPSQQIPEKSKDIISLKLHNWTQGTEILTGSDDQAEQILRIRKNRVVGLNRIIQNQFSLLGKGVEGMDIIHKRQFCRYLQELPRDPAGYYTGAKIRELTGIPKSTYYALLNDENYGVSAERKRNCDEEDIRLIRQVLDYKGFDKGIRQVYMLMPKVTGQSFSVYRIRRLMNRYGIRTTIRRPSKNRKAMKELIARNKKANLLMRKFRLHRPNEVRLTDVTYLDYGEDKRAYGSASVDPVTGRLICFIVSENNDLQLALDTLKAMDAYPAKNGAILHSDQGTLYMTDDFQAAVVEKELNQSMSRRGNCWDNAPQESFFGHFKDECPYQKCVTLEELRSLIDGYAVYYNTERGMWEKEHMTPEEYEKYLESMDETQWQEHLAHEEERYQKMKEKSAAKAVANAKQYREEIQERLEEIRS